MNFNMVQKIYNKLEIYLEKPFQNIQSQYS